MSRLLLLGTGTPAPLVHRAGSSYLLQTGEQTLLIDCGPGSVLTGCKNSRFAHKKT